MHELISAQHDIRSIRVYCFNVNKLDENWVLLWSYEEYKAPDNSIRKLYAQESFRIKDDKIIRVNQFQRDLVE